MYKQRWNVWKAAKRASNAVVAKVEPLYLINSKEVLIITVYNMLQIFENIRAGLNCIDLQLFVDVLERKDREILYNYVDTKRVLCRICKREMLRRSSGVHFSNFHPPTLHYLRPCGCGIFLNRADKSHINSCLKCYCGLDFTVSILKNLYLDNQNAITTALS